MGRGRADGFGKGRTCQRREHRLSFEQGYASRSSLFLPLTLHTRTRLRTPLRMGFIVDWLARLKQHASSEAAELDLTELRPGDVLKVGTRNTLYILKLTNEERFAEVQTDHPNRPSGKVKIMGCTFGLSSTISPNHLFCGGSLEFSFQSEGVRMTHTTSAIRRIELVRRETAAA